MKDKKKNPSGSDPETELLTELLADSEDIFRTIIQASPDGIVISDLQGRIIFATTNDFELLGISDKSEITGTNVLDWIDPEDHEKAVRNIQGVFQGVKSQQNQYRLLKKNGERFYGAINAAPLFHKTGKPLGMISIVRDITEIKKTEEDLRQKEYRYRLLFESAHDSIFLMDQEVFVECNPKTLETFGCTREDIIGKSPMVFSPAIQPDGSESGQKAMEKIRNALKGENQTFEWRHITLNGSEFDAEVSLNRLELNGKIYLQAMVRNISKRKKADNQLRKFSECLLSFGEDPQQNIKLLTGLCGEILNASFTVYHRLSEGKLSTLSTWNIAEEDIPRTNFRNDICCDVITQKEKDVFLLNDLPSTKYYQSDPNVKKFGLRTFLGKLVWFSGEPVGIICAGFRYDYTPDTADQYLVSLIASAIGVEEERWSARRKLLSNTEDLKETNLAKDKFFSIIAHDLKGPFNAILGFSEILTSEWDDFSEEERLHFIRNINSSAKNTYQLLENLLEWSVSQTGRMKFNPAPLDLSMIANEMVILFKEQAERKQIKLFTAINFGTVVYADENMLRTIFRNLVSNAIKFSSPGGDISILSKDLPLVSNLPKQVEVCISDNGIGIPAEVIPRLFRIDEQVRTRGTNQEKGTGLGLVLCRELVEKNKGKIYVESETGKGSRFYFSLPAFLDL